LGINESNFSQSNLKEFNLDFIDAQDQMTSDEASKILLATGNGDTDIQNPLESDWFYYSWESDGELTEFTLLESSVCEDMIHYFVFSGSEFISKKLVALSTNCGDWEQQISSTVEGGTISIKNFGYGYEEIYPNQSSQKCIISAEGIFECTSQVNVYPGVSLWNGLALRETPDKKGKYITLVNIGETFTTADSVQVKDDDEYLHIQLKDGTKGYILNRLVMQKAVPLAILKNASIYRRPDELTKTSNTFSAMDVVGFSEMFDDYQWLKVKGRPKGEKWFKEGWIKSENGTQNPIEIAVASLVKKALEEKDSDKQLEMLEAIRSNKDFSSSQLMENLNYLLQ